MYDGLPSPSTGRSSKTILIIDVGSSVGQEMSWSPKKNLKTLESMGLEAHRKAWVLSMEATPISKESLETQSNPGRGIPVRWHWFHSLVGRNIVIH